MYISLLTPTETRVWLVAILALVFSYALPTASEDLTLRNVVVVGNNWEGTVTAFDPESFEVLKEINVVPDYDERVAEIRSGLVGWGYFVAIRHLISEGHGERRRPPLLRVRQRTGPRVGDLVRGRTGDRQRSRRRPSPARADGPTAALRRVARRGDRPTS